MIGCIARLAFAAQAVLLLASLGTLAQAQGTLRIAMTASDVPKTTGAPDNGFEGLRFLRYPVYEALVLWDLTRADKLAEIRPGLAKSWEQDQNDRSKWIFHLRRGVKFHDGSDFNADAVVWNLGRYFKPDSPRGDPTGGALAGQASTRGLLKDAKYDQPPAPAYHTFVNGRFVLTALCDMLLFSTSSQNTRYSKRQQ